MPRMRVVNEEGREDNENDDSSDLDAGFDLDVEANRESLEDLADAAAP